VPGALQTAGAHTPPTPQQPAHGSESGTSSAPIRTRRGDRQSFLDRGPEVAPPTRGWRAAANRLGFSVKPSADEIAERDDIAIVSRSWDGPRTIAVVNGKGGANKTPTTAMLAAVFARYGSAGVLAWDNNETRGTLGWRTEQGLHDATVHDLLPRAAELMMPSAEVSDLARYVHHQPIDRYDVLRSNPRVLANQQHLTRGDFDTLHKVMRKYYRLLILDSGNDESADRWQQMIQRADALVIATTALGEHAEAGALLLEQLAERDARTAALAAGATVIVSQSDPNLAHGDARAIAAQFRSIARAAMTIPFDDAMHSGRLRYDELARPTQRAWLAAAAAVAEGL
jgi:MinD-like ATPase involved in chromosome partitioning or flagellar assembly